MTTLESIKNFINNKDIAVIGTSTDKKKFGYIIFNNLRKNNYNVFPINPGLTEIEGIKCYPDVSDIPSSVKAVIFVTKPEVTEKIAHQIRDNKNIEYLWFQPGSASKSTIETEKEFRKNIIAGECILIHTKASGFPHNLHRFFNKLIGKNPK